jgi:predicted SnoaL-like aldol condensation-catalyzing enzyme
VEVAMIMKFVSKTVASFALPLLFSVAAAAQDRTPPAQANPSPGCVASQAEIEANKKVAMDFFRASGEARVLLLDPSYKQHNPVAVRRAQQENLSDFEEAKKAFLEQAKGQVRGLGLGPTPSGNRFEIVTAECDIVTIVHQNFRHDPTGQSKFYEAFTFDTFRVKAGKLVEHWDGASFNAPVQTPANAASPK